MTLGCWLVTRQTIDYLIICWPMPSHSVLQNIFWYINQHRARSTSCRNMKRLANRQRQIICAHYKFVVFSDAASDAYCVALLKRVGANRACRHLAGYSHHRNRVHICVAQRSNQVCCRRTACHHRYAWSTSYVCVTFGHVTSTLLMTNKNVANARLN